MKNRILILENGVCEVWARVKLIIDTRGVYKRVLLARFENYSDAIHLYPRAEICYLNG